MISVIVPTYNGALKLPGVLEKLLVQTKQADEVIVVVDGSTDNTFEVLDRFRKKMTYLKVVQQENKGRAVVRNRGAMEAKGNLLIFLDDDMLPEPNFLAIHFQHHQRHEGTLLTGAQIEFNYDKKNEVQEYRVWLRKQWTKDFIQDNEILLTERNFFITAANFSVSKEVFEILGGFNEGLTDGEDFDLAFRAFRKGYKIFYNHKAFAWHNDFLNFRKYIKRNRDYWAAGRKLQELEPNLYIDYYKERESTLKGNRRYLYRLLCFEFLISAVDKGLFKFLPIALRYKLYNLILIANCAYHPDIVKL